jgi:hypothetical protein
MAVVRARADVESQIAAFIARYAPPIARELRACRRGMRARFAQGFELVYDNYNALVFGYGPDPRPSHALLSLAAYPRWVTLCFLQGARLSDPARLLSGSGRQVRSLRLASAADLARREVEALIESARADVQWAQVPPLSTVIRSVSVRRRPRRPEA